MSEAFPFGQIGRPWWSDRPVFIVGVGPSLAGFNFERLRGLGYVLSVKKSWPDVADFADAWFCLDLNMMRREPEAIAAIAQRTTAYLAIDRALSDNPGLAPAIAGCVYLRSYRLGQGLSEDPGSIESGANSGHGAFNVAYLKRARLIVLLGFDYGVEPYCAERYAHNPPGHNARYLPRWATNFDDALPQLRRDGIRVINASPQSTVGAFERMPIEEAMGKLHGYNLRNHDQR